MTRLYAVRGAITLKEDTPLAMSEAVVLLMDTLVAKNRVAVEAFVSVQLTVTPDLVSENPARALRTRRPGYGKVPMLCAVEPDIDGMLPLCLRVMVHYYAPEAHVSAPIYLQGAQELRPDLV